MKAATATLAACITYCQAATCDCSNPAWCLPIVGQPDHEVFAFWTGADDWESPSWDWNKTTTIAAFTSNPVPVALVCKAHANGARVVKGADFPKHQLSNATARSAWVNAQIDVVQSNFIDGINIDIEQVAALKSYCILH